MRLKKPLQLKIDGTLAFNLLLKNLFIIKNFAIFVTLLTTIRIDMENEITKIRNSKEKVREDIVLAMRRRIANFKSYLTDSNYKSEHLSAYFFEDYPADYYYFTRGKDYGCKDDIYYYWIFPKVVEFIYQNNHYRSNRILFNDKFKCWFVFDKDKNEHVTFEALDTDSQIVFLEMLDHFVDYRRWAHHY